MNTVFKKKIMRRIYTAYAMRLVLGSRTRYFALMLVSVAGLIKLVSVVDVLKNFSRVTVGQAGDFVISALLNADIWTLLVLGLFVYAGVAFVRSGKMDIHTPHYA